MSWRAIICTVLLIVATAAFCTSGAPLIVVIRHTTMECDVIVEGTILSVGLAHDGENARTAILKVERVVWSEAPIADKLVLNWTKYPADMHISEPLTVETWSAQLDKHVGQSALWMLVEENGLRCRRSPISVDELPSEELHHLSGAVRDPDYVDPARPGLPKRKLVPELEEDPLSAKKRSAMIEFLDGEYEARRQ